MRSGRAREGVDRGRDLEGELAGEGQAPGRVRHAAAARAHRDEERPTGGGGDLLAGRAMGRVAVAGAWPSAGSNAVPPDAASAAARARQLAPGPTTPPTAARTRSAIGPTWSPSVRGSRTANSSPP